jgi:tetraacyldisaccharide 4'-kinase
VRPLSALYDRLLETRARRYADGRSASERLARPVVSVGNLTVGGTGKTPLVRYLAERLLAEGRRPAILSRGYGRSSREVVVVSSGEGPRVGPDDGGDEPVLLARATPGAIVVVARRRADAARAALAFAPDAFLLDDGFQHLSVQRDLDLLLLDARDPFGSQRYPPFGRLREPLSAIGRADAVVFTRSGGGFPSESARRAVLDRNPTAPIFTALIRATGLCDGSGAAAMVPNGPVVAVCGIARPDGFRESLQTIGISPAAFLAFADHRRYGSSDVDRIARAAREAGAIALVTTEKDAVKLEGRVGLPLFAVRLTVEVAEPGLWSLVRESLTGKSPPRKDP